MSVKYTVKNVSPLGELDVALLRRVVAAGGSVDVSKEQADQLLEQEIWEPVSKPAVDLHKKKFPHLYETTDATTDTDTDTPSEDQE